MSTRTQRLQADLEFTESQLLSANTSLKNLLDSQVSSYEIENYDNSRQKVISQKIETIRETIKYLENKRESIYRELRGRGHASCIRLRRG